jgi:hypothetical protein
MANASIEGARYIVVGAEFDSRGRKQLYEVNNGDFSGKPSYQALANEYIEPPIKIRYQAVQVDGKRLGVFEIGDCQDRPYMMRVDYSEQLRRGDAYISVNEAAIKMGRRQLQDLFEMKFRDSVSLADIEVGFPGEIIHKHMQLPTCDLSELPSAVASNKLQQLMKIQMKSRNSGSTSVLARLTHARLYGSDDPYVNRSPAELMDEMKHIRRKYRDHDQHFLFESHAEKLQLVVYNQGKEEIRDASLALALPNHKAFYIADRLPKLPRRDRFADRSAEEQSLYPSVSVRKNRVHVSVKIGDIPVGEPVEIFSAPLRLCAGHDLRGGRCEARYSLFGQNLRSPAKGELRLQFS